MCLGIPGRITHIRTAEGTERTGRVDFGGTAKDVNLACVPDAQVGDYVIVHVGFAISRLDEVEAKRVFDYLKELGELKEINA